PIVVLRPRPPRSPPFPYTTLFRSGTVSRSMKNPKQSPVQSLLETSANRQVSAPNRLLLFDIDGTLIHSDALWKDCYERGIQSFLDRKSTRLNSSHVKISYAVFCLK